MIAVVFRAGEISVESAPLPARPPGFALIRCRLAGICNTDFELLRGYYGFAGIPGHEFVGQVVESDTSDLIGRRVVGEINLACGRCEYCLAGLGRHCCNRTVLGIKGHSGAFAEYLVLPDDNVRVLPEEIPDQKAVFTEPLAAACEILDQVPIRSKERVAVLGDGKLGLLVAMVLCASGAQVVLYGRHENKLAIARTADVETALSSELPAAKFQIVVECTGSAVGLADAIHMARPRGVVVMKSTVVGDVPLDTAYVVVQEITLIGSRCGRFTPALELLKGSKVDPTPLISAEFPLQDAAAAFDNARRPGVLKVLLRSGDGSSTYPR